MIAKIIEATNMPVWRGKGTKKPHVVANWGKFVVLKFDEQEWALVSALPEALGGPLLQSRGWARDHIWVLDIETCEGAGFRPGGLASADLQKHKVWVCPLFEPFLQWLYGQDLSDISKLPSLVRLDAEFMLQGYRRPGK